MPSESACDHDRRKSRPWTSHEDQLLLSMINASDKKDWSSVASKLDGRTGKQCRERYNYHLEQEYKKGGWTTEEDRTIIRLQRELGNSWSKIAKHLPGRNDNSVKNRWYCALIRHNADAQRWRSRDTTGGSFGSNRHKKWLGRAKTSSISAIEEKASPPKDQWQKEAEKPAKRKIRTTPWTWEEDQDLLEAVQMAVSNILNVFLFDSNRL
jgi:hypothetical protein